MECCRSCWMRHKDMQPCSNASGTALHPCLRVRASLQNAHGAVSKKRRQGCHESSSRVSQFLLLHSSLSWPRAESCRRLALWQRSCIGTKLRLSLLQMGSRNASSWKRPPRAAWRWRIPFSGPICWSMQAALLLRCPRETMINGPIPPQGLSGDGFPMGWAGPGPGIRAPSPSGPPPAGNPGMAVPRDQAAVGRGSSALPADMHIARFDSANAAWSRQPFFSMPR